MSPLAKVHGSLEVSQTPEPVTIPFVVVTHWGVPLIVEPAVPLILRLLLAPILRLVSPLSPPPKVRVCLLVVPRFPKPVRKAALLLPVPAETEAVGVPLLTFSTANLAEAEVVPPMRRSRVELIGVRALPSAEVVQ